MPTIHEIEPELLLRTPRRIKRNTDTWNRTILSFEKAQLVLLPFLVIGLGMILMLLRPYAGIFASSNLTSQNPHTTTASSNQEGNLGGKIFLCLVWNGMVGVMTWAYFVTPFFTRRIYRDGTPAIATIISKKMSSAESTIYYSIKYEFIYMNIHGRPGSVVNQVDNISGACWEEIVNGDQCTVLYLANRPRMNVLYLYGGYRVIG